MGNADRAYLTVLGWPAGSSEDDRIEMLVRAAGLDPYNARLAVRRGAPQVVCLVDALIAGDVVGALGTLGVRAAAPTRSAMEALPEAVRGLRVGRPKSSPRMLGVKLKDGSTALVDPGAVSAVLRATVATTRTSVDSGGDSSGMMSAMMVGGMAGAAVHAALSGDGPARKSVESRAHHIVELQAGDGRRFRFDPRLPATQAEKLEPGGERMDRLAVSLAEACPNALVDHSFREFRCPPDVLRTASSVTGTKSVTTKDEWPLFEFFSAWMWLVGRG